MHLSWYLHWAQVLERAAARSTFQRASRGCREGGGVSGSIFTYVLRFTLAITPCTFATRAVHGPRWVKNATQTNDGAIAFCVRGSSFFVPSSVVHFPHSQHSSTLNTLRLANADSFVLLMGLRGCPVRAVDVSKGRRCKGVYYTRNPWLLVDLQ